MGTTEKLAQFIVETGYEDMPVEALHAAKRIMIDTLGVMIAGSQEPAGQIISSFVRNLGGKPRAWVVGKGFRTSAPNAALANGTIAHALDYDDLQQVGVGHPTVALLPAVLAIGEEFGTSGKAVLAALVLGFEVWSKLAASGANPRVLGFHPTAVLGSMGAAAAAAKLLELDIKQTQMVLGLAASHAMGMGRNRGTMTKPYHAGNAARSGVTAAMLVREGFTAAPDLIEGQFGFCSAFAGGNGGDDSKVTENLGNPYSIVSPGIGVKKYPTCHFTHRAIDALLQLADRYQIFPDDIADIESHVGYLAGSVLVFEEPVDYLQGKFSMQFCLATAILERKVGLHEVTDEMVNDPRIRGLMKRVRLICGDEPLARSDIVKVRLKDGKEYSLAVDKARGDAGVPLTDEELISKYRDCAGTILPKDKMEQALELILNLEQLQQVGELMDIVGRSKKR
ncbi:MmgE/PrpD family protein [Chloroflexota bacterium]